MTDRDLTVSAGYRPVGGRGRGSRLPMIRLSGSWLSAAGFPVGARVRVEVVEAGRLVLTRLDEEGEELGELAGLVWIPAAELIPLEKAVCHA